jgi:diamine N-acetyltransferase
MKMLENEYVQLRALEPEDLASLYKWENDNQLWEYGNTLAPFSKYILHRYIENSGLDIYEARQLRLVIEDKKTKNPVGTIDLYDFEPFHNRAGIGILIDEVAQGKGFATQALNLMKDYAFQFLKLSQLYAYIPAMNIASLKLFRNCGFMESGLLKKWNKAPEGKGDVFVYQCLGE